MSYTNSTTLQSPETEAMPGIRNEVTRLLVLALPIITLMVTRMLMGFVDFTMVSRLGTDATAAISPATIFVFNIMVLGMGPATSAQTFAAQCMGRGDKKKAVAYAWQTVYLGLVFLALSWPISMLADDMWALFNTDERVSALAVDYCRIAFWSMGFSVVAFGLEGFFNGVQKPSVALWSAIIALAVNIVVNYALIFGHFGMPALGIKGAAYATVFAWMVRTSICVGVLVFAREFREEYDSLRSWRFNAKLMRDYLKIGWPVALQFVLDVGAWNVFTNIIIASYGVQALAASNIGFQLLHLSFMPAIGFGIAASSLIGHAIGESRHRLAAYRARVGVGVNACFMGCIGLLFFFGRYWLPTFFNTDNDPEVVRLAAVVLFWAATYQLFDAFGITYSFALRAAGDTFWSAIAVIAHCWTIFVGGGILASRFFPEFGIDGPWMMCTIYIATLSMVLWRRFEGGKWREIQLFDADGATSSSTDERASENPNVDERIAECPNPPVYTALQPDAELPLSRQIATHQQLENEVRQ